MNIIIPEHEVTFSFARSGGKGGQNVNKVNTKAVLSFDVMQTTRLTDEQKFLVCNRSRYRTTDCHLIIACDETRSQGRNRDLALKRLNDHLSELLTPEVERIATNPTRASQLRRLNEKRQRSSKKEQRRLRHDDE